MFVIPSPPSDRCSRGSWDPAYAFTKYLLTIQPQWQTSIIGRRNRRKSPCFRRAVPETEVHADRRRPAAGTTAGGIVSACVSAGPPKHGRSTPPPPGWRPESKSAASPIETRDPAPTSHPHWLAVTAARLGVRFGW